MTAIDVSPAATSDDSAAIAELHDVFATQRAAFLADPSPSLAVRQERLMALAGMMLANRERIRGQAFARNRNESRMLTYECVLNDRTNRVLSASYDLRGPARYSSIQ